jgi:DNA (cytosine-5)-methyltransferase 1
VVAATGPSVLSFITAVPHDGGSRTQVPRERWLPCHRDHNGHKDVYGRVAWDRPANTITSGCNNPSKGRFVHPDQNRALSLREAAALQGFPDTFRFYGESISRQIGNAVPPPLARAIAEALKAVLTAPPAS